MSVLSETNEKQLEGLLVSDGVISADDLETRKAEARQLKKPIISYLLDQNVIDRELLTKYTAQVLNLPYVNLKAAQIDAEILKLLPQETAKRFMAVPLGEMQNRLVVAMLDADNVQAADFLSNKIGRPLKIYMASEKGIENVISQYDIGITNTVEADLQQEASEAAAEKQDKDKKDDDKKDDKIKTIVQDSPISSALSTILEYAVRTGASDIHIEPLENILKIRTRIDGVLREIMKLPKSTEPAMISRIKILSNLRIDEHRIPQDGTFTVRVAEENIDLRIAISPTVWGEQAVIRILDKTGTTLKLEAMGYTGRALRMIRKNLERPNGMILTSGPTGSGKSTSMYAMLTEIISDKINIVTLEDPVEYKIDGVNQIQVNPDIGLTFATGLRSILRQDPDVVMVGEIRDRETAQLAVQAALTGHLVFATLHTNSAAGILPRLLDMGIEPFLIASTVNCVIGQRLVRRLTKEKVQYSSTKSETESVHETLGRLLPKDKASQEKVAHDLGYQTLPLSGQNAYTLFKGKEGKDSPGGYKGRAGLYEVFEVTEAIEELIIGHATSTEVQRKAKEEGLVTMREDGYLKALAGITTIEEVNRVAAIDKG
jgi:type IV pilus assembly protein PilB